MNKRIFVFWTLIILIYQVGFSTYLSKDYREAEAIEEPSDYEYTPLVREGVMWEYVHTGMNHDNGEYYTYKTYCYISGTVEVDGKVYHKCFVENTNLDDVCVAYLREEDKRVYMMSVWEDSDREIYFYNTNGKEELIYDFNLNVGDTYSSYITDLEVKNVKYEEVDGTVRKIYEVYGERKLENSYTESNSYTIVEGIGVTDGWGGIFCFPYIQDFIGAPYPVFDQQIFHEYTPLVEEGKVWYYTESWGWLAVIDNARVAMRGQDEINGKVYTKCWLYYDHCEFSEDDAMLLCYMREEDKRVYMIPAVDSEHCPSFFLGYESYASDIADAQEYLLYDFNLSAGDSYCEVPDYNNEWLYHTIESVDFIEIDGKLRKKYVLSNSHNVIEGIGIIGDFSGYVCSPNPVLLTYEYTTPRLSHITLDNETIFLYYGGDPCLSNEDPNTIKVEKIGDLTLYQTRDVVTIGGAIGKVNVAIYTFDGVKAAEASGNGSATLLTYELPIGIYVVKATDSTGNKLIQKIVIK